MRHVILSVLGICVAGLPVHAEQSATSPEEFCKLALFPDDTAILSVDPVFGGSYGLKLTPNKLHIIKSPHAVDSIDGVLTGIEPEIVGRHVNLRMEGDTVSGNFVMHLPEYDVAVDLAVQADPAKTPKYYVLLPPDQAAAQQAKRAKQQRAEMKRCRKRFERASKRAKRQRTKQAVEQYERGRKDGFEQGRKEGLQEGHQKGFQEGKKANAKDQEKKTREAEEDAKQRENKRLTKESKKAGPGETSETVVFKPRYNRSVALKENQIPLKMRFAYWDSVGKYFMVRGELENRTGRPFCVGEAKTGVKEQLFETRIARLEGDRTIAGHETATVTVAIRENPSLSFGDSHRIEVHECNGERSFAGYLLGWNKQVIRVRVAAANGMERWQKMEREMTQLAVGPRFFGGAFWIPNGRAGDNRKLKASSFYGFGLRLNKGFNQTFAFEAEIVGGTTGEATFDAEGGELRRKARFGRAQLGGVLRFGYKGWIPIVRGGIGVQGTSYDSETTGSEPDDSIEFSGLLGIFGGGVDYRANEQFVMGIAASAVVTAEDLQTFEIGAHIRYGWNP